MRTWPKLLLLAIALSGGAACIIGPKHDDPSSAEVPALDAGSDGEFTADTTTPGETAPREDTAVVPPTDAAGDSTSTDTAPPPCVEVDGSSDVGDGGDGDAPGCGDTSDAPSSTGG